MIYYAWLNSHGRGALADGFDVDNPFGLSPGDIVDRIFAASYALDRGTATRDAEEIDVQELRAVSYDPVEWEPRAAHGFDRGAHGVNLSMSAAERGMADEGGQHGNEQGLSLDRRQCWRAKPVSA